MCRSYGLFGARPSRSAVWTRTTSSCSSTGSAPSVEKRAASISPGSRWSVSSGSRSSRAPAPLLYGADALGGVVNIITRRAKEGFEATGRVRYGSFNDLDAAVSGGGGSGAFNLRLSTAFQRRDAYRLNPNDAATSGSAFTGFQLDARGEAEAGPRARWIARADYSHRALAGIDTTSVAVFDRKNQEQTLSLAVGPELRLRSGGRLKISAYGAYHRDQFLRDQRGAATLDATQDSREQLGQLSAQLDLPAGGEHVVSLGAEALYDRLESERLEARDGDLFRFGAYVQDEWAVLGSDAFVVVPGLRVDLDSVFGLQGTPKLALRWQPVRPIVLRGSVGRGFRAPTFKEQLLIFENPTSGYVVRGNPDLAPETSWSYSIGAEARLLSWLRVSVSGFRNDVDNLITTESTGRDGGGPERFTYVNVARARTQGVESSVRITPVEAVSLDLNAVRGCSGYRSLTSEAAVRAAPDVILVTDHGLRGMGGKRALFSLPGLAFTPAMAGERVVVMDDLLLLGFGPRVAEAVTSLARELHPELAR